MAKKLSNQQKIEIMHIACSNNQDYGEYEQRYKKMVDLIENHKARPTDSDQRSI